MCECFCNSKGVHLILTNFGAATHLSLQSFLWDLLTVLPYSYEKPKIAAKLFGNYIF